jgi:hypothetical protein
MHMVMTCDIYAVTAPSNDSGGAATLSVLVLAGQRNRLDVVTEVEWIFQLHVGEKIICLFKI